MAEWPTVKQFYGELRTLLVDEQKRRTDRPGWIGDEPEWVRAERNAMWDGVNRLRLRLGQRPAQLTEILRVEGLACGHVDYTNKFAWGCAELAAHRTEGGDGG